MSSQLSNFISYAFLGFLYILPKKILSHILRLLVEINFPKPISTFSIFIFAKFFKINIEEAEKNLSEYQNIGEFFGRRLKTGLRPIGGEVISPVDGKLTISSPIKNGQGLQVKGMTYQVSELIGKTEEEISKNYKNPLWSFTLYLAPHNYHRVHCPIDSQLENIHYFPGKLWPVNEMAVTRIKNLFGVNERMVFEFSSDFGKYFLVMVAALNVGNMKSPFWGEERYERKVKEIHKKLKCGDELGIFYLGSTVVLLFEDSYNLKYSWQEKIGAEDIRMGNKLE